MKNNLLETVLQYIKFFVILIAIGILVEKITYKIIDIKSYKETKEIHCDSVSPVTRSYNPGYKITEDSARIKRLEQEYKRLVK